MWGPSFLSVLHDLWLFCTGQAIAVEPTPASNQMGPSYSRDIVTPVILKKVRLNPGVFYVATNPDTIQIRSRLGAYDSHIISSGPLTEYEWLLYSLQDKHLAVPLLALRLTPLGRWHTTLKGQPSVSIGVTPYTDALMEWREGEVDRIGWVHEVSPDESIVLGELGTSEPGLYQSRSLQRSQWLELRPVFTSFV